MILETKVPSGPVSEKWKKYCETSKPINPANKRKYHVIVVGTGLAGASAAASLGELGYNVSSFCFQDSPRRAHSIAAQGGINAAKNYKNDGDNVWRLFCDTIKGGDFRAREANVYRLAELSVRIIDHCVAQGVPFAREYGGLLDNRSFGGSLVSRTFYARGQTGQQLLLGAYSSLNRQINKGTVKNYSRMEFQDLIVIDGVVKGVIMRDLVSGEFAVFTGDAVVLATGGYSAAFYLSTNAVGCNVSATYRAYKKGALFANPCFTQIHPTCIPQSGHHQSKLTLMSESLRNDGRVWVPKEKDMRSPNEIPETERDYYLERKYPSYGNLAPRDIASRAAKQVCDDNRGVGPGGKGVYLDFENAINRLGKDVISARYGNLFEMYEKITGENPYETPMRIYPAMHYSMGGLWVNYELMSNLPGLFVIGEANFSDHGANRLGASALMQTLADGYFILPNTISSYLNTVKPGDLQDTDSCIFPMVEEVRTPVRRLMSCRGNTSPNVLHSQLGRILWEYCGMSRNEAGLLKALTEIKQLKEDFWKLVRVPHYNNTSFNQVLEKAIRVVDFMDFSELLCLDALERKESCGGHFREEYQTEDGEAKRNDEDFCHVAAWKYNAEDKPTRIQEELVFEHVPLTTRSYK
ncbi:MAG: fumarate reductase/succinate dehydrogenase flavoprotein subunit [Deltaproteobacteria bacterium]|nr:MAG: fumarate reductase/succinate dehydrogenase flavoprotein subunit [Deltaproteobacteria bacterium]